MVAQDCAFVMRPATKLENDGLVVRRLDHRTIVLASVELEAMLKV
jgi:hypothetical protein